MQARNELPPSLKGSRCIVHIDLDCFYCQVEQVRLGLSSEEPVAVQQWHGLIAVNYAARKAGVQRMANVVEAKKACPDITFVHVATYGPDDQEPHYYPNPNRSTHKVSLDPYRQASKRIFAIFRKYCDTIQKIGSDEGFMDMTTKVNERIMQEYLPHLLDKIDDDVCDVPINWDELGVAMGGEGPTTWQDLQLAVGAKIAKEIRQEIFDELHYTCSAGIAHCKVVAKLCSSRNKPNKQTVLRKSAAMEFMREIPFTKIRNLGGKLGNEVESELGIETAGDVWKYDLEDLQKRFGESTGLWIYNVVRGDDEEEVNVTKAPKSLMASKSHRPPVRTSEDMYRWMGILSAELHNRILTNFEDFQQWPRTISLSLRTTQDTAYRTKSCPMLSRDSMKSPDKLTQKTIDLLGPIEDATPCVGMSLQATGLVMDQSATNHSIAKLFEQQQRHRRPDVGSSSGEQQEHLEHQRLQSPKEQSITMPTTSVTSTQQQVSPSSIPPKKTGLLSFYSKKILQEEKANHTTTDGDTDNWFCDKCFKKIPRTNIEEHTDYHFALDLQNQERSGSHSNNSNHNNNNSNKRGSPSSSTNNNNRKGSPEDVKRKRLFFFQPQGQKR
ncbi:hypothetical protein BDB00DRAFT_374221 [Zychaea mexicana]|uniref:uncharacterized protein n=1 Tax=Zychaea mexicana TaxID=64656 RepID=UPI0022FE1358|nr:uncharacterized protein BDB00DRAFT_374221 [Zychaea mexicana]KAI9493499.1 hypothetical protein BDB00DRAFT_374221 [Zychaea mexicana]